MAIDIRPFGEMFAEGPRNGLTRPKSVRGSGVKMVNMGELFAAPRIRNMQMDRVPLSETEEGRFLLRRGDLLLARQSLVLEGAGKCSIFLHDDEPVTFEGHITRVRLNPDLADPQFYFYYLQSPHGRASVRSIVEQGAGASGIRGSDLAALNVIWQPLPEQRAVANFLAALDDKIELNQRMNETLEAIARAIFKSWFVDFDPVRAKMEGHEPVGGDHSRFFPEQTSESGLGQVPTGWRYGTLNDVLGELVSGARPRGGAVETGVPSIGAENVEGIGRYDFTKEKFVPEEFFEQLRLKGADVRPGDVLLYKDGANVGRKSYVDCGFPHELCAVNEHVFIVRADRRVWQRFLYFWLDQPWVTAEIVALNSNSAQPGINQTGVKLLPLLLPGHEVLIEFDRLVAPLTDRLFAHLRQSGVLAALRDTLLPKLIAGQIRIKDADGIVEATI